MEFNEEKFLNGFNLVFRMVKEAMYEANLALTTLNGLGKYFIATQQIPWENWSKRLKKQPQQVHYCISMEESHLTQIAEQMKGDYDYVVGLGGGVACDTGKYLAWRWNIPLITIPSIISVDAFLSKEVGVRNESRVRYVGSVEAKKIIIDFDLIRSAPPHLNRAGIGDVLSCVTALGDWRIAHQEFGDPLNEQIFTQTKTLIQNMFNSAQALHDLSDEGLKKMVEYLREECILSEQWGNARPEEGGEHFLAYALEKICPRQYLHGALISLNVLVVLKLQGADAIFKIDDVQQFLSHVGVQYSPKSLQIRQDDYKNALEYVQKHVRDEKLFHGLWTRKDPFTEATIEDIIDWIYTF
jgi:glycerol dehydrogenase-like iron-containing ADH family enzyme